jgi:two-component system response regulator LytT
MISIIIIEDDEMSSDLLVSMLNALEEEVEIKAVLRNVHESITYLRTHPSADLIFSDIQLPDGQSFMIFSEVHVDCPIIFTSAFDK